MSEVEFVLTREGYEDMRRELNEILTVKRPEVIERIREARQIGDPAENSDYDDAKRCQAMLEARVKELKVILAHASVVESIGKNGSVGIGSKVLVKDLEEAVEDEYIIVGAAESSPSEGRISYESCVGSALMGTKVGDVVSVEVPGGIVRYEVLKVS